MSLGLHIKELTPELWPALEKLFGKNGACAGCWCMFSVKPPEGVGRIAGASACTGTLPFS